MTLWLLIDALVLDASVAISWCFPDDPSENTPYTQGVLDLLADTDAILPEVWAFEIANSIFVACNRRKRIDESQVKRYLDLITSLPIRVESRSWLENLSLETLARKHDLAAYDVAYLDLVKRQGLQLATTDGNLSKAARAEGVRLVLAANQ